MYKVKMKNFFIKSYVKSHLRESLIKIAQNI
jgi:hypothetical protein